MRQTDFVHQTRIYSMKFNKLLRSLQVFKQGILYQVRWVRSHPEKRHTWLIEWNADDALNSMAGSLATLAIQKYLLLVLLAPTGTISGIAYPRK